VIFHVFIHIKCIQFLGIKSSKEHSHHKTEIKRLHWRIFLFHTPIDIIIICAEIFCWKSSSIHFIIIFDDIFHIISLWYTLTHETTVHPRKFIFLWSVSRIGKNSPNVYIRLQFFKNLIITDKHGYTLYCKKCIKLPIKSGFFKVIKYKLGNFSHTRFFRVIHISITVIIFH